MEKTDYFLISSAHLKANFAVRTAMNSFMTAAATIVPDIIDVRDASIAVKIEPSARNANKKV